MSTATDRKIRGRPRAQALLQSHHADCEANFVRLSRLLVNFDAGSVASIALPRVGRRPDFVDIRVVDRTPYTLLVEMSQREPAWGAGQCMMMQVRVYLDARMAEVVACQGLRQFKLRYDYPNPRMLAPDEKRQLNHFFGEWLAACLHHGHSARPLAIATGDWAHG